MRKVSEEAVIANKNPMEVEFEADKTYYWCRCGRSQKQPFCDGAHEGTTFTPLEVTVEETKKAYLCMCKRTNNSPFCDGAHTKL